MYANHVAVLRFGLAKKCSRVECVAKMGNGSDMMESLIDQKRGVVVVTLLTITA